jgi:hypothetical protein
MKNWRTEIRLQTGESTIKTKEIKINRGIFQGDSLSALWFCIALNPLSNILNQSKYGYQIDKQHSNKVTLNHLLYVDDIKLFASNNQQISSLLQITETFSSDIKMNFGIDKCKTCSIEKGKLRKHEGFQLASEQIIKGMNTNERYKYLGFIQTPIIDHRTIKSTVIQKYKARLTQLLKTNLNGRNIMTAINTYAMPLITYTF